MKDAKIINDTYNLVRWLLPILGKYPRNFRFSLGVRMENCLYDLQALLQNAYHSEQKRSYLEEASLKLEQFRLLSRLSFDLRLLDKSIHHALIEQVENIGRQLGGWMKSTGAAK